MKLKKTAAIGVIATAACALAVPAAANSDFSYMEPVAAGAKLKVLATSGDTFGGVLFPGVPDGMGVLKDGKNAVLFVGHELSTANAGSISRANGAAAASTVTALNVNVDTQSVTAARDLLSSVVWWDYANKKTSTTPTLPAGAAVKDEYGTPNHTKALNRFCSSSITQPGVLAYREKGKDGKFTTYGYTGAAYFTGEEGSDESRGFVMNTDGQLVQLPKLGLAAWENYLVNPASGRKTVVMGNEDGSATDSQLYMYVGQKETTGEWWEKAGLTNGQQYVMQVPGSATDNDFRKNVGKGVATMVNFNPINTDVNGKEQNLQARATGTVMARVEDGAWDPKNPNVYYFVTTESNKDKGATTPNPATPTVTRDGGALWRLAFNDVKNPTSGATLTMLLNGTEAPYLSKPDNIEADGFGNILIQEDPGGNDQVARMVAYRIADGKLAVVTKFKDEFFKVGGSKFITRDEESSGVVDATDIMRKGADDKNAYYLYNAQIHATPTASRPDLAGNASAAAALALTVEGGQVYLLTIPNWDAVYAAQ
jgi:secreted PhoX family phosphatase